jgi:hypothetical protein
MTALYTTADLKALAMDKGPFAPDAMRQALMWAAQTLEAADAAVNAERRRAEIAESKAIAPQAHQARAQMSDEQIDAITREQWGRCESELIYAAHRAYARTIERWVMRQPTTLQAAPPTA